MNYIIIIIVILLLCCCSSSMAGGGYYGYIVNRIREGELQNMANNQCLSLEKDTDDKDKLEIRLCTGKNNQKLIGNYKKQFKINNLCLQKNRTDVTAVPCTDTAAQKWEYEEDTYKIKSLLDNTCLLNSVGKVVSVQCGNDDEQKWKYDYKYKFKL